MPYVIHKSSRAPTTSSYAGPTWDEIGLRHLYREVYYDKGCAEYFAKLLSEANPVGFEVAWF